MGIHPAIAVLAQTGILLSAAMALISWLILGNRRDARSRFWHSGLYANAIAILAISVFGRASAISSIALVCGAVAFMGALRAELTEDPFPWGNAMLALTVYAGLEIACDLLGARQSLGVMLTNGSMALLHASLLLLTYRVEKRHRNRGLLVVAGGVFIPGTVYLVRAISVLRDGDSPGILSMSAITNASLISVVAGSVLMMIGYLIFSLEKSHQLNLANGLKITRIEERGRLAQNHADELQALLSQRDQMIMMSSRFSAASSLAIFNSAIIHEISQPLQALRTRIDIALARSQADPRAVVPDLERLGMLIDRLTATVGSLRGLLGPGEPACSDVDVADLIAAILPIVRSEAERRSILISYEAGEGTKRPIVQANKILLERVLLNLLSNAIEAFDKVALLSDRWINISTRIFCHQDTCSVVIVIRDNGIGFPETLLQGHDNLFRTTKAEGLGLGLTLSRIIAEGWQGRLEISNWNENGECGACVELCLPFSSNELLA